MSNILEYAITWWIASYIYVGNGLYMDDWLGGNAYGALANEKFRSCKRIAVKPTRHMSSKG